MDIELQLILGLNCNFKCNHCLNNSYPGNRNSNINEDEFRKIMSDVLCNKDITNITFSGGEPLLYLEQISSFIKDIRSFRKDIRFSITTNGSLIKKYIEELKELKIEHCLISFDKPHEDFISEEKIIDNILAAKSCFELLEINNVFEEAIGISRALSDLSMKENIKVNFTECITSGRYIKQNPIEKSFKNLKCPNYNPIQSRIKISYIHNKGYTLCCGPVVFDKCASDETLFFNSFSQLAQNDLFNFFKNTANNKVLCNKKNDCDNCKLIFSEIPIKILRMYSNNDSWKNVLFQWEEKDLNLYNTIFNPKYIYKLSAGGLSTHYSDGLLMETNAFDIHRGFVLNSEEIEDFTNFTIDSFYNKHSNQYDLNDITRFKEHQKIFFGLEYFYNYIKIKDQIVSYFIVCKLKDHPFFCEDVWHIGYWGISDHIKDTSLRKKIKSIWTKELSKLNQMIPVVANIDFFNTQAIKMSERFGFEKIALRLDRRV